MHAARLLPITLMSLWSWFCCAILLAQQPEDKQPATRASNPYLAPADASPAELAAHIEKLRAKPESIQARPGFADALIGVLNRRAGCATTYTFDRRAAEAVEFTAVG